MKAVAGGRCPRSGGPQARARWRTIKPAWRTMRPTAPHSRPPSSDRRNEAAIEEIALVERVDSRSHGALGRLQGRRIDGADQGRDRDDNRELREHLAGEARHEAAGRNTLIRTRRDADDRADNWSIALIAASWPFMPCSIYSDTPSTMTMASSTATPIASTMPNRVERLTRKSRAPPAGAASMMVTGTVVAGTSVARKFCWQDDYHYQDQNAGLIKRRIDLRDRIPARRSWCRTESERSPCAKRAPNSAHLRLDLFGDPQRIGLGRLEDGDAGAGPPVQLEILRIRSARRVRCARHPGGDEARPARSDP